MGSAVGHSWGFLPDPSDPPALSFQGLVAERAQGALHLRQASVPHGTHHMGPWRANIPEPPHPTFCLHGGMRLCLDTCPIPVSPDVEP